MYGNGISRAMTGALIAAAIGAIYDGLKNSKIFGPLIRAGENLASAAKETVAATVDKATELAGAAKDKVVEVAAVTKERAAAAYNTAKDVAGS